MYDKMNHVALKQIIDHWYKRIKKWLYICLGWIFVMAGVGYLWDHWLVNVFAFIPFIYPLVMTAYVGFKLEPQYAKIKPKNDFLKFQYDELIYKKAIKFFNRIGIVIFVMLLFSIVLKILSHLEVITFDKDIDMVVLTCLFGLAWIVNTNEWIVKMRMQYVKYYVKYDTKEIIKEKDNEQLDQ